MTGSRACLGELAGCGGAMCKGGVWVILAGWPVRMLPDLQRTRGNPRPKTDPKGVRRSQCSTLLHGKCPETTWAVVGTCAALTGGGLSEPCTGTQRLVAVSQPGSDWPAGAGAQGRPRRVCVFIVSISDCHVIGARQCFWNTFTDIVDICDFFYKNVYKTMHTIPRVFFLRGVFVY